MNTNIGSCLLCCYIHFLFLWNVDGSIARKYKLIHP